MDRAHVVVVVFLQKTISKQDNGIIGCGSWCRCCQAQSPEGDSVIVYFVTTSSHGWSSFSQVSQPVIQYCFSRL